VCWKINKNEERKSEDKKVRYRVYADNIYGFVNGPNRTKDSHCGIRQVGYRYEIKDCGMIRGSIETYIGNYWETNCSEDKIEKIEIIGDLLTFNKKSGFTN
jgi:hypothetical protein